MSYKKFTIIFLSILASFLIFNFAVWNLATKYILERHDGYITGNLARMGYITSILYKRKNRDTLSKKHFEVKDYDYQKVDMLTLGDSFSNGAGGGLNRYYQDYMATYMNWNILNIYKYKKYNEINTLITLLNSGFLKKIGVKYVLYETIKIRAVNRLVANINFNTKNSIKEIEGFYNFGKTKKSNSSLKIPKTGFINNGNFKYIAYKFLYNFSNHAFISKVYIAKTKKSISSIKPYDKFLFYKKELTSISNNSKKNLEIMNDNLNRLASLLGKQGIKLIFMPVVNKLDFYYPLLRDKEYPKDPFFDTLRELHKNYILIDTKAILSKGLKSGVKDIFYYDDTHWSYKASDMVSKDLKSLLKLER